MDEQPLFEPADAAARPIRINDDCYLHVTEATEAVSVRGIPVLCGQVGDLAFHRLAMVQLVEAGAATQQEVARSFGVRRVTIYRQRETFEKDGTAGLVPKKRGPKGPSKLTPTKQALLRKLRGKGATYREIGQRLGVAESSVRAALKGWSDSAVQPHQDAILQAPAITHSEADRQIVTRPRDTTPSASSSADPSPSQATEPELSTDTPPMANATSLELAAHQYETVQKEAQIPPTGEPSATAALEAESLELAPVPVVDVDPADRAVDRMLARQGLLHDAGPLFGPARGVPGLGVLLAVPILVLHGVFADAVHTFHDLGAAFYGLRNTVLTLLVCFLRGIKRPENLKAYSPTALGQVLGLDRAPEMKTLRRKLRALATQGKSLEFLSRQARRALQRISAELLWLYVDGHVAVYSGKHKLAKHHVTQMRIALPAVLDYWVNDERGDPVLVWSGSRAKNGLVPVLEDVIEELRRLGERRPITLVFDRGGWSPALFARLAAMPEVYFVTYRKGQAGKRLPRLARKEFRRYEAQFGAESVEYDLADKTVRLPYGRGKKRSWLELRQVTRRTEDGHQTHVLTNRRDTPVVEIARRMFGRWTQENFLKYMGEQHAFDGLLSYLMEEDVEPRSLANPKRMALKQRITRLREELEALRAEYGQRARLNPEATRSTMRGFKIANGKLGQEIARREQVLEDLEARLRCLPARLPPVVRKEEERPMRVNTEVRQLSHGLRMAAVRAESALRELLRSSYRRWYEDSRTLVRVFLRSRGDLEVREGQLRIVLDTQSAPHRTRALAQICEHLTSLRVRFPASDLTMHFEVRGAGNVTGSR